MIIRASYVSVLADRKFNMKVTDVLADVVNVTADAAGASSWAALAASSAGGSLAYSSSSATGGGGGQRLLSPWELLRWDAGGAHARDVGAEDALTTSGVALVQAWVAEMHGVSVLVSAGLLLAMAQALTVAVRLDFVHVVWTSVGLLASCVGVLAYWHIFVHAQAVLIIALQLMVLNSVAFTMDRANRDHYLALRHTQVRASCPLLSSPRSQRARALPVTNTTLPI